MKTCESYANGCLLSIKSIVESTAGNALNVVHHINETLQPKFN